MAEYLQRKIITGSDVIPKSRAFRDLVCQYPVCTAYNRFFLWIICANPYRPMGLAKRGDLCINSRILKKRRCSRHARPAKSYNQAASNWLNSTCDLLSLHRHFCYARQRTRHKRHAKIRHDHAIRGLARRYPPQHHSLIFCKSSALIKNLSMEST